MKKVFILSILAAASFAVSALEVGIHGSHDYAHERNTVGVSVTTRKDVLSTSFGFDRVANTANDQNRFSVGVGYNVFSLGQVKIAAKVGAHYLDNQVGSDGYAMSMGVGFTVPVVAKVDAVLDVTRQFSQERVKASDGNRVSMGLVYKF